MIIIREKEKKVMQNESNIREITYGVKHMELRLLDHSNIVTIQCQGPKTYNYIKDKLEKYCFVYWLENGAQKFQYEQSSHQYSITIKGDIFSACTLLVNINMLSENTLNKVKRKLGSKYNVSARASSDENKSFFKKMYLSLFFRKQKNITIYSASIREKGVKSQNLT